MTTITRKLATRPSAKPLSFDERLALASVEIDSRIDPQPFNLVDVVRIPVQPTSAPNPYRTPIAALLHRAWVRIEAAGWCRGALREEDGRRCLIGAIQIEADSRHQADDACALLLDVIRREFGGDTVPSWNDSQSSPKPVLLALGRAAELAHSRSI